MDSEAVSLENQTQKELADLKDPLSRLDIRVGKIIDVQNFVVARKTYVNHVLYDDRNSRAAISRIKGPYRKKTLKKRMVIVVLNVLHKVKHFESEAFILYARDEEKDVTELLDPPVDSEVGDRIIAPGIPFVPMIQMPYIKPMREGRQLLDKVTADMRVDSEGYATYKGIRLESVMNGAVTVPTARECPIVAQLVNFLQVPVQTHPSPPSPYLSTLTTFIPSHPHSPPLTPAPPPPHNPPPPCSSWRSTPKKYGDTREDRSPAPAFHHTFLLDFHPWDSAFPGNYTILAEGPASLTSYDNDFLQLGFRPQDEFTTEL